MDLDRIAELLAAEAELLRMRDAKAARARAWYAAHRDDLRARYEANRGARREYYLAHKDRILALQRVRYYNRKAIVVLSPPL